MNLYRLKLTFRSSIIAMNTTHMRWDAMDAQRYHPRRVNRLVSKLFSLVPIPGTLIDYPKRPTRHCDPVINYNAIHDSSTIDGSSPTNPLSRYLREGGIESSYSAIRVTLIPETISIALLEGGRRVLLDVDARSVSLEEQSSSSDSQSSAEDMNDTNSNFVNEGNSTTTTVFRPTLSSFLRSLSLNCFGARTEFDLWIEHMGARPKNIEVYITKTQEHNYETNYRDSSTSPQITFTER